MDSSKKLTKRQMCVDEKCKRYIDKGVAQPVITRTSIVI